MADIILKNRDGKDITYLGVKNIRVPNADGGTTTFTDGSQLEVKTEEKYVNFFDYEGTLLYSYTKAEAAELASLPDPPVHPDYGTASWNWTLASIQDALEYGIIDVGAIYRFPDAKFFISIASTADLTMTLNISGTSGQQQINLDWGDGTTESKTISVGSSETYTHTYAATGDYVITIHNRKTNAKEIPGISSVTPIHVVKELHHGYFADVTYSKQYTRLEKLMISAGNYYATNSHSLARNAYSLRFLAIPRDITQFGGYMIYMCTSLLCLSIPDTMTTLNVNAGYPSYNYSLKRFPNLKNVTSVFPQSFGYYETNIKEVIFPPVNLGNSYILRYCYAVKKIKVSEGTTAIGSYFAQNCYSLDTLILPSTLSSVGSNFLSGVPNVKIYAPDDMVDAYKAKSNLSNFANYIFPISEMPVE